MKGIQTIAFGAALLSTCAESIHLQKRTDGPAKVVALPIQRNKIRDPVLRDSIRRRDTQQVTLDNLATLYFANGSIGTPAQVQRWHLDTGSSDLWVNTPASELCSDREKVCVYAGSYRANSSSTYEYISSDFNISYVDGSGATGDYVSDTVSIGKTTLERLQFGIGYVSSAYEGILGIGYPINEVQVGRAGKQPYDNLPARMVTEKLITTPAYSIWLNDLDASTGSILFGGVDTDQYMGTLETVPIQTTSGYHAEFLITLTGLTFGGKAIASNIAQAVLLDTGSSLTYLPNAMTKAIFDATGAEYDEQASAAYIPCSQRTNTSTLEFTFSGPTISVDMSELIIDVTSPSGKPYTFSNTGERACIFGIAPAGSGTSVLGDTFLRSAYVVYDMGNNEISLAQTRFNATSSSVLEIGTGKDGVPNASAVSNPVTATGRSGGGARMTGTATLGTGSAETGNAAARGSVPLLGALGVVGLGLMLVI